MNARAQGTKRAAAQPRQTGCTHKIYQEHTSYMWEMEHGGYEHLIDVNCVSCTVLVVNTACDGYIKATRKLPVFVCVKCRGMLLCSPCYEVKKPEYKRSSATDTDLPRASKRPARPEPPWIK
jgi:23S rRNA A2030 N6-methylase RlmJ